MTDGPTRFIRVSGETRPKAKEEDKPDRDPEGANLGPGQEETDVTTRSYNDQRHKSIQREEQRTGLRATDKHGSWREVTTMLEAEPGRDHE